TPAQVATTAGDTWLGCVENNTMFITIVAPVTVVTTSGGGAVTAAEVAVVSRPQFRKGFRGERLVIPGSIAANFSLNDIKVGNRSQTLNSVAVPAVTFVENGVGMRLLMDTAPVAMDIALVVANQSDDTLPFRATLIGRVGGNDDDEGDEPEED